MMYVDDTRCNGCGACLDVCPTDALTMKDGQAFIDEGLCESCAVCQSACPQEAILPLEEAEVVVAEQPAASPLSQPSQEVEVLPQAEISPMRNALLPALGSALAWTGREVLPRLASLALDALDRRVQSPKQAEPITPVVSQRRDRPMRGGGGQQRRQRRRRGRF